MSTSAWIDPVKADAILGMKGKATFRETAQAFGVSVRTVQRIWTRGDADGRYHAWSIVSDPHDRAMIRTAYRAERAPGDMDPEDMERFEILLILRKHTPEEVARVLRDAGMGAS